jgi:hypothetical protein
VIRRLTAIGASFPIALSGQTLDAARFRNPSPDVRPAMLWSWSGQVTDSLIDRHLAEFRRAGFADVIVVPAATDDVDSARFAHAQSEAGRLGLRLRLKAPADSARVVADLDVFTPEQLRAQLGARISSSAEAPNPIGLAFDPSNPLASVAGDLVVWIGRAAELARGRSDAKMAVLLATQGGAFEQLIDRLQRVQAIFDVVPADAIDQSVTGPGELQLGGQAYHTVVVPPGAALTRATVARLATLSRDGGTVIAWRPLPAVGVAWPDTGARFHALDSLPELRDALMHTPWSGVRDPGPPALRVRALARGEDRVFVLFNASDRRIPVAPTFRMIGQPELWDPDDGSIQFAPTRWSPRLAMTDVPIDLDPFQLIGVVFKGKSNSPRGPIGVPPVERTAARSDSTWRFRFIAPPGDTTWHTSALGSWTQVDSTYSGTGEYEGTFALAAVQAGARYVLDLGQVREVADVAVNGQAVGRRLWRPYRFDVTKLVQQGTNRVTIRVTNTPANHTGKPLPSGLLGPVRLLLIR